MLFFLRGYQNDGLIVFRCLQIRALPFFKVEWGYINGKGRSVVSRPGRPVRKGGGRRHYTMLRAPNGGTPMGCRGTVIKGSYLSVGAWGARAVRRVRAGSRHKLVHAARGHRRAALLVRLRLEVLGVLVSCKVDWTFDKRAAGEAVTYLSGGQVGAGSVRFLVCGPCHGSKCGCGTAFPHARVPREGSVCVAQLVCGCVVSWTAGVCVCACVTAGGIKQVTGSRPGLLVPLQTSTWCIAWCALTEGGARGARAVGAACPVVRDVGPGLARRPLLALAVGAGLGGKFKLVGLALVLGEAHRVTRRLCKVARAPSNKRMSGGQVDFLGSLPAAMYRTLACLHVRCNPHGCGPRGE